MTPPPYLIMKPKRELRTLSFDPARPPQYDPKSTSVESEIPLASSSATPGSATLSERVLSSTSALKRLTEENPLPLAVRAAQAAIAAAQIANGGSIDRLDDARLQGHMVRVAGKVYQSPKRVGSKYKFSRARSPLSKFLKNERGTPAAPTPVRRLFPSPPSSASPHALQILARQHVTPSVPGLSADVKGRLNESEGVGKGSEVFEEVRNEKIVGRSEEKDVHFRIDPVPLRKLPQQHFSHVGQVTSVDVAGSYGYRLAPSGPDGTSKEQRTPMARAGDEAIELILEESKRAGSVRNVLPEPSRQLMEPSRFEPGSTEKDDSEEPASSQTNAEEVDTSGHHRSSKVAEGTVLRANEGMDEETDEKMDEGTDEGAKNDQSEFTGNPMERSCIPVEVKGDLMRMESKTKYKRTSVKSTSSKSQSRLSEVLKLQKSLETAIWTNSAAVRRQSDVIIISDDEDTHVESEKTTGFSQRRRRQAVALREGLSYSDKIRTGTRRRQEAVLPSRGHIKSPTTKRRRGSILKDEQGTLKNNLRRSSQAGSSESDDSTVQVNERDLIGSTMWKRKEPRTSSRKGAEVQRRNRREAAQVFQDVDELIQSPEQRQIRSSASRKHSKSVRHSPQSIPAKKRRRPEKMELGNAVLKVAEGRTCPPDEREASRAELAAISEGRRHKSREILRKVLEGESECPTDDERRAKRIRRRESRNEETKVAKVFEEMNSAEFSGTEDEHEIAHVRRGKGSKKASSSKKNAGRRSMARQRSSFS